jgi:hypothetical protein
MHLFLKYSGLFYNQTQNKTNGRDCNAPTKKTPTPYENASNKIFR